MKAKLWSTCLGNLFEHYDAALFGFLSPFLAPLFFPQQDPLTALLLTYAMIPMAMLARPIGSLVFGLIGDRFGRERALFLTLSGMALISGLLAICPSYSQIGLLAPIFFCMGRFFQNFFSSGETMGGALYLLENSPEKRHGFLSSIYNASTMAGILLASAGISLLSLYHVTHEAWRWLYGFGCIVALFGFSFRRRFLTQNSFSPKISHTSWLFTLWIERKALFWITICSGFAYANYSIALIFLNGFIPLIAPLSKDHMMHLNTSLLILDFAALPLFGFLTLKISREKLMLFAALIISLFSFPLFMLLKGATLISVICIRSVFVLLGVAFFAPFHGWAKNLVDPSHRYLILSFGYALGSQLLGSPVSVISLWLFKQTGTVIGASLYWITLGVLSTIAIIYSKEKIYARGN